MLTYNDVSSAIKTLDIMKNVVEEQIIIDSSGTKDKKMLRNYAKTNKKIKIYNIIGLGIPETCLLYGIRKCQNQNIVLLDADEVPSKSFTRFLKKSFYEYDAYYITRYETPKKNLVTKQLRVFNKDSLDVKGLPHERISIMGQKHKLDKSIYLMHEKPEGERIFRDYEHMQKIWYLTSKNRLKFIFITFYMTMLRNPKNILPALKKVIVDTRKTKEENGITEELSRYGIIKYLDLDTEGEIERLTEKYKNKEQGPKLLIKLLKEKYRSDNHGSNN